MGAGRFGALSGRLAQITGEARLNVPRQLQRWALAFPSTISSWIVSWKSGNAWWNPTMNCLIASAAVLGGRW